MDDKKAYEKKQQAQLDEWAAEIDKLKAKAERADAEARIKISEELKDVEAMRKKAEDKFSELQSSSDDAWKDVKQGFDEASRSLASSLESAASRFA